MGPIKNFLDSTNTLNLKNDNNNDNTSTSPSLADDRHTPQQNPFSDRIPLYATSTCATSTALTPRDIHRNCFENDPYIDLDFTFEDEDQILNCYYTHNRKVNVTSDLVQEFLTAYRNIKATKHIDPNYPQDFWAKFYVMRSKRPDIFSFGGDLDMFIKLIKAGDRQTMQDYATNCILACHDTYENLDLPFISLALIEGDALGGGLECALACDYIVAERDAPMGMPEVLFGMFPGMGAYSFLRRKIGAALTEKLIYEGKVYSGQEMYDMGIVDFLAENGEGDQKLRQVIARMKKKYRTYQSVVYARRRSHPLDQSEMMDIVNVWVDCAINATTSDMRKMQRLSDLQKKRLAAAELIPDKIAAE